MNRDRANLWTVIAVLTLLIVAEFVGNAMVRHWRNDFSQPDPRFEQMGGKR